MMADYSVFTTATAMEQVAEVTATTPPDIIGLTNGYDLPRPESSLQFSSSSSSNSAGSRAAEAILRNIVASTTATANALLGASSSIPSSISTSASSSSSSSLVDGVIDKGLIYAPSFPNYMLENATMRGLPRQIYQWSNSQSQYLLNGTSGPIDWDSGLRNSLYSDGGGDPMTAAAAAAGQAVQSSPADCDDVYVSENGMAYQVVVYCMYIVIFVLALLGNGVVCYIVQSSPRMRTVTNYFIFNLAIGDVLMSLFCVPFSFISILILGYWPFGVVLCHLVNYSQAISVLVSAYTLVAISVDRYIVIMWPLRPRITKR